MKVKDLIKKLQMFDPELPVCLYDWQEEYVAPSEGPAEVVNLIEDSKYWPTNLSPLEHHQYKIGTYVCIGG